MKNPNYYKSDIESVVDFIERNLKEDINIADITSQSVFSNWEFQRLFRAFIGDSIGGYLKGRRLSVAADELRNGQKRIIEIAIDHRFSSQESFSRAFKKFCGYTPAKFRKEKPSILTKIKPRLDKERVQNIVTGISKIPDIKTFSSRTLVGRTMSFDSSLGSESQSFELISQHWKDFHLKTRQALSGKEHFSYGLISAKTGCMDDKDLLYSACTDIDDDVREIERMSVFFLPEKKYAVFSVVGQPKSCHVIADYIYGIWLPQSSYERAEGFDLEVFDSKSYMQSVAEHKMTYCLPIK